MNFLVLKGEDSIIQKLLCGRYQVVAPLGTGSAGSVYLVRHIRLESFRAIKCLSKAHSKPAQVFREVGLLSDLQHPCIPVLYDFEEDDSYYYLIMEFVKGESLQAMIQQQKSLTYEECLQIGLSLCDVMEYLHHQKPQPIFYLDLKPEHIFCFDGHVKLVDLEIMGEPRGNRQYSAPELFLGGEVNARCDIYSIGKVLQQLNSSSNPLFSKLIQKATAIESLERYETVTILKEHLLAIAGHHEEGKPKASSGLLSQSIAVVGCQPNVGTTHVAVSLTCAINHHGRSCVYQENPLNPWIRELPSFQRRCQETLLFEDNLFRALPAYGTGILQPNLAENYKVMDLGCIGNEKVDLSDYSMVLLVIGSNQWDEGLALQAERLTHQLPNRMVICNYADESRAKYYSKLFQCPVYRFPKQVDPYHATRASTQIARTIISGGE